MPGFFVTLDGVLEYLHGLGQPVTVEIYPRQAGHVINRLNMIRPELILADTDCFLEDLLGISEPAEGEGPRVSPQAGGHEALHGRKVLVIDDDPRNVFAITSTLELHGMTVTQAANGRKGIEALLSAEEPDLILMDVMMPELDGYATMSKIRQMPAFATLPIIAVTARAMPGDREKSLAAGASDYVTKPVDTDELLACMERWLSRRLRSGG